MDPTSRSDRAEPLRADGSAASEPILSLFGPRHVQWVAHAGGAISRPGGTPTAATIAAALDLDVEWVEVDVCATSDLELVLRHDVTLDTGMPLSAMTLGELRRRQPGILTLDEAAEIIGSRASVLLDLKTLVAVGPLSRWMRDRSPSGYAACTESLPSLVALRSGAPRLPRWLSLPDMGTGSYQAVRSVITGLLRHRHTGVGGLGRELRGAIRDVSANPGLGLGQLGGVAWRAHMPDEIRRLASEVGASALSLHHWVVTPQVCEAAHREGLPVAAWTVNRREVARRLVDCGVDLITTDYPVAVRGPVRTAVTSR